MRQCKECLEEIDEEEFEIFNGTCTECALNPENGTTINDEDCPF